MKFVSSVLRLKRRGQRAKQNKTKQQNPVLTCTPLVI